jgi:hypothetical protein
MSGWPRRRLLPALVTTMALVLAAAACSGDDEPAGTAAPTSAQSPTPQEGYPSTLGEWRRDEGMAPSGLCGDVVIAGSLTLTDGLYDAENGRALDMAVELPPGVSLKGDDPAMSLDWMCVPTAQDDVTVVQYDLSVDKSFVAALADDGSSLWTRAGSLPALGNSTGEVVVLDGPGPLDELVDPWTGDVLASGRWAMRNSLPTWDGSLLVNRGRVVEPGGGFADLEGGSVPSAADVSGRPFAVIGDPNRVYRFREYHRRQPNVHAYNVRSGKRLWAMSIPVDYPFDPFTSASFDTAYDPGTEVAAWVSTAKPITGSGVAAVDARTGELLWRRGDYDRPGLRASDGIVLCADGDDVDIFDSRTGRPIALPADLTAVDVSSVGLLVVDGDGVPRILSRSELRPC